MLGRLLRALGLSCPHHRLSRPISRSATGERRPPANDWRTVGRESGDYVVCLDCGREFPYDWEKMQVKRRA